MSLVGYESSDDEIESGEEQIELNRPTQPKASTGLEKFGLTLPPPKHSAPPPKKALNPFSSVKRKIEAVEDEQDLVLDPLGGLDKEEAEEVAEEEAQDNIQEFNVADYYAENKRLKEEGLLEETKQYKQVYDSKNQLRSLMRNAEENKDVLDDLNRDKAASKKQRRDRYGW